MKQLLWFVLIRGRAGDARRPELSAVDMRSHFTLIEAAAAADSADSGRAALLVGGRRVAVMDPAGLAVPRTQRRRPERRHRLTASTPAERMRRRSRADP